MARREVLVQLDDDLVARLDELAAQLGTSRSELLRRGATAVITAEERAVADRELIAGYQRQPPDPALANRSVTSTRPHVPHSTLRCGSRWTSSTEARRREHADTSLASAVEQQIEW